MTLQWEFKTWDRSDKVRDPIQGEFFSTDAIRNPAEAFVRETVQNSLDAGIGTPVRVRFYVSGLQAAVPPARMARYFNGAWSHFTAGGNGLRDVPSPTEVCPFLVCEDFSTRGLEGDPAQWQEFVDQKNHFYYFFRTEGRSAKSDQERGRWGIGKYVFPRSSRINSFFAVTVRRDKRRLLMGQAVLKSHRLGDNFYKPDGWFGQDFDGLVLPFEDTALIDEFCADFKLTRENQAGLSVVVPWYDEEVKLSDIIAAAARDYFYKILSGDLVIDVETPTEKITLTADTLEPTVRAKDPELADELAPLFELSKWAIELDPKELNHIDVPPPENSYKWIDGLIPVDLVSSLRQRIQTGERIGFRIHLNVYPKDKQPLLSYFDVFLVRDDADEKGRPVFIRGGIIISDVRPPARARGIRAVVVVDDQPLATLLGDSENPAHTQWQKDGSNFKGKYKYGPSYIEFVTGSVVAIVRAIVETEQEVDPTLLIDFFSLPSTEGGLKQKGKGPDGKKKQTSPPPSPHPPRKPQRFRINRISGGFSVTPGDADALLPPRLEIRTAYDVRRGNPITRYRSEDFRLNQAPIKANLKGLQLIECEDNRMLVAVLDKDFGLTVNGFDENRDLVIRAAVKGDTGDTTV